MKAWTTATLFLAALTSVAASASCANGGTAASGAASSHPSPSASAPISPAPTTDPRIKVASGFSSNTIAAVPEAREVVALPNGDLLVGTSGSQIYLVPGAENAGGAGTPIVFIKLPDSPAQGIALSPDHSTIYAATEYDVFRIGYKSGDRSEPGSDAQKIASIRTGPIAPGSDGDVHITSSVAVTNTTVYVGVGSSCNACVEADPTRASIQAMKLDGSSMHTYATRIRNPIALAIDPSTGALWVGDAGQDSLPYEHPYEFMDAVSLEAGSPVDYGWPDCEENHVAYTRGANCSRQAIPRIEFPAYATHIGAVFYPSGSAGAYAFPAAYRGALFVASHGSWHCCPSEPPQVAFVPMHGDTPAKPINWSDPNAQWTAFMWNFGGMLTKYIGRPTGIAVGSKGSLFVADDQNGVIYRVRPAR